MTRRWQSIVLHALIVAAISHAAATNAAPISSGLTDRLALYLPFNGNAGDASGNNVTTQAIGSVVFAPGIVGQSASIQNPAPSTTREAAYVRTTDPVLLGADDFSVQVWAKGTSMAADPSRRDPAIVSNKDWNSGSNVGWVIARGDENANTGGGIQWNFDTSASTRIDIDLPASVAHLEDGNWHHVVVTHDRDGEARMYFDDQVVAVRNISAHDGATIDAGLPTAVGVDGAQGSPWNAFLNGSVDEVAIWRRVLDASEVTRLYNNGLGLPIPEPSALSLALAATLAVAGRRQRIAVSVQADRDRRIQRLES